MNSYEDESHFKELLYESVKTQWEKFHYYRTICKKKGFKLEDLKKIIDNEEYYQLPSVVATAFKKSKGLIRDLNDLSMDGKFQVSSSTSGDPSYIYTSPIESDRVLNNYRLTFGIKDVSKALAFSPSIKILSAISRKSGYLGKKSTARMKYALDAANMHYRRIIFTVDINLLLTIPSLLFKGRPILKKTSLREVITCLKESEDLNERISIGGIVLLLAPYLDQMKEGQFSFNDKLQVVLSGGGYSGAKGTIKGNRIIKKDLVNNISSIFGMERKYLSTNIKDIYGFTECPSTHEGYWSDELEDFKFKTWRDSRAYVVDPETEKPLKHGEGLLKFITPYTDGNPSACNVSLLQLDLATIVNMQDDYRVTEFSYIKRLQTSSVEGCAYKAEAISNK